MIFRRFALFPITVTAFSATVMTKKPTGTSFLPEETIERAKTGSPIEKIKLEKDGSAAWVDVYEYARKIREGEMTWEEVEKADLDTVRSFL
jgi:ferredoxin-nitrite reductase